MKAIIIEEKDVKALLNQLELEMYRQHHKHPEALRSGTPVSTSMAIGEDPVTLGTMHRWFHYVVTKWLQEQGSDGLQR